MATIYVNDGDTVIINLRNYKVSVGSDGPEFLPHPDMCIACHQRPGDDFQHEYGNLCGRCITTAMEGYALQLALDHLMNSDEEIVEVMHVMERIDADARTRTIPHVDFHSACMNMAWTWSDDNWPEVIMSWSASIRQVFEARILLERP